MNLSAVSAVARRPDLWAVGIRQLFRVAPRGWWRRPPFLPIADPGYMEFRTVTQYGDPHRAPEPRDVVAWLEWCRKVQN